MATAHKAKPVVRERANQKEVESFLQQIADRNGGRLTPEQVVTEATHPDSPIHDYFEWNDETAANHHRLNQARTLIRSCRIVIRTETTKIKTVAYVRDPSQDAKDAGYISVEKVRNDADMSRDVLLQEFARAGSAMNRARKLAQVFGLQDDVDSFIRELEILRFRAESAEAAPLNG